MISSCWRRAARRAPEIRRSWSERFELLMVDEFQDTNRAPARAPGAARPRQPVHGRRRVPGDLRLQARRGGDLPRARRAHVGERGGLALTHNFRSRPALVGTVGAVFEERIEGFTAAHQRSRARGARRGPGHRAAADRQGGGRTPTGGRSPPGCRARALAPRRGTSARPPVASSSPVGRSAAATSRCCCARSVTSRCTSAPCSSRASPRWPPRAPSGGQKVEDLLSSCVCSPIPGRARPIPGSRRPSARSRATGSGCSRCGARNAVGAFELALGAAPELGSPARTSSPSGASASSCNRSGRRRRCGRSES